MDASEAAWTALWEKAQELGPDPELSGLSDDEVEREVRAGAARIAALTCQWLVHVAELVVRGIWADAGARTPGQWLSWRCGVAAATGREHVRVALALRNAPRIRERFAAGTISYSKVRAITRVSAPETEEMLLDLADRAPASQLERIVAGCRHQMAEEERWAEGPPPVDEPPDLVRVEHGPDTVEYRIRMSAEDAMAFDARVERLVELADRDAEPDEQPTLAQGPATSEHVPIAVRRAIAVSDALAVAVADGAPDRSGADDHLVVLHVDAADLADAVTQQPPPEQPPAGQPGVHGASAEAASPRTGTHPARRHRVVTGRGCGTWADDGPTDLANLIAICGFHHRFIHRAEWVLRPVDPIAGRWSFHAPAASAAHPAAPPLDGASAEAAARVLDDPSPDALEPPWWDGAYDLSLTIAVVVDALRDLDPTLDTLTTAA